VSDAGRWTRVKEIFDAVVATRVEDRTAVMRDLCGDDRALQAEVESLLASDAGAGSIFERPVDGVLRARVFSAVATVLDHEPPALTTGERLGPYEITGLLGAGGMGRVYRAHDTTLGREVALKILPELWLADPDRRARLDREARMLAALNHPNIGSIYGVHEGEPSPSTGLAVKALVLELVEGETLAERIALHTERSAAPCGLPVDEVMRHASQVIEALEAAHERGIVHRDLKPANIKVTPEGRVKVLDFGLARAAGSASGSGPQIANSPTITVGTQKGVLLGTAPYMSPEQARGRAIDKRTDIWAFGCVLYEMLTGARAFAGDGIAEVLANVIKTEPDWTALPTDTPPALRLCLQRCLQKNLRQRFHDIADVRLAMEGAFEQPTRNSDSTQRGRRSRARLAYVGSAIALVAIAAVFAIVAFAPGTPADVPETRLEIVTPPADDPLSLAISPDGRSVVFQAGQDPPRLWLRPLDSQDARLLAGTEGAQNPFWSPDSQSVAFSARGELKRIDLVSGLVRTLVSHPAAGGTWNVEGTILLGSVIGPLISVPADGGTVTEVTRLLPGQNSHRWPQFLPDGRRFLLYTLGAPDVRGVYLGSTDDVNVQRVSDREFGYRLMPPSHLLFAREGALWGRRLRGDFATLEGEFVAVAPKVLVSRGFFGHSAFSSSATGSIAYRASAGETQLVWLDRTGRPAGTVGRADDGQLALYQLSRDGRVVAVTRTIAGNTNVWLLDTERGVPRRLSFDLNDNDVILSPDGARVVHQANGPHDGSVVYERRSDGTGEGIQVLEESVDEWHHPQDWSADGRYIMYAVTTTTGVDLRALPLFGERTPFDVARTSFAELNARFSPDSRWVAYQSTETGQSEIYVQPFPGPGPKVQVSVGGGTLPRWRGDGGELFYVAPDRRLMAVSVVQSGSRLETGPPRALFTLLTTTMYEPSANGQRFLVTAVVSQASPISIVLNWKPFGASQ
jgi:serine/threonine protein kinase/Tol biopolymer transport system component